ncbi:MAG: hypothetical protein ACHRXM_12575 [Isosphaerales bacterium]
MSEIDEFKARVRGAAEAATERIRQMHDEAARQYRERQSNYAIFLDLGQRIRKAIRPWVKAFAESEAQYDAVQGVDSDGAWAWQGKGARPARYHGDEPHQSRDPALADTSPTE